MEIWDAYDISCSLVKGIYLKRGETIPEGLYHLVCEVLVQHTDGTYLLMQRDREKVNGGKWEASAGGSALKGENSKECAKRELFEETGIIADNFKKMYSYIMGDAIVNEFFLKTKWSKDAITLQKGETQNFKWVSTNELISMKKSKFLLTKTSKNIIRDIEKNFYENLKPNQR